MKPLIVEYLITTKRRFSIILPNRNQRQLEFVKVTQVQLSFTVHLAQKHLTLTSFSGLLSCKYD